MTKGGGEEATATNAVISAGTTSNLTAEQDLSVSSQAQQHHAVKDGIRLFTQGVATNPTKPNQETGIKLHAAQGKLSSQSQSGATHINASKDVHIASTEQTITIAAPQHLLLTAGGAYIRLEGGNIEVHGPGVMAFKGSLTELAGPGNSSPSLPDLPAPLPLTGNYSAQFIVKTEAGDILTNYPYAMTSDAGHYYQGVTDSEGKTVRFYTPTPVKFTVTKTLKTAADNNAPLPQRSERFNEELEGDDLEG